MDGIEIVEAGVERLDEVEPIWLMLSEHHADLTPPELPVRPAAEGWAVRRRRYEEALAEGAVLLLATHGGEAVGFLLALPQAPRATLAIERLLEIETVAVLPAERGSGIGSALMDAVEAWADAQGISHLQVSVRDANPDARRLYERRGFKPFYTTMIATRRAASPTVARRGPSGAFTIGDREGLKDALIRRAESDESVVAAALLGSSATGGEDRFSDIDLALSSDVEDVEATTEGWTRFMYEVPGAVHHLDVRFGAILYRVFLLRHSLQVDLSFWPSTEFVATGPRFRTLFGRPPTELPSEPRPLDTLVGEAWLYLIHARSSAGRGRRWQAIHMISVARDRVLELACRRHGLRPDEARGVDDLPPEVLAEYASMLPASLDEKALSSAVGSAATALMQEAEQALPDLAARIAGPVGIIGGGRSLLP